MINSQIYEKIIETSKDLLFHFDGANPFYEYITSRFNEETVREFNMGYFPSGDLLNLITPSVSEAELLEEKLLIKTHNISISFFENHNLILPYYDICGNPIALVGRTILNDEQRKTQQLIKYKNTTFKKGNYCFNLDKAKKYIEENDFVYVVEGQFDAIKCWERGVKNVVAVGSSSLTPYQCASLSRYTDNLFLLFDSDEAGDKGRQRALEKFKGKVNITNVYVPMGYKDIDEYLNYNEDFAVQLEK